MVTLRTFSFLLFSITVCQHYASTSASAPFVRDVPDPRLRPYRELLTKLPRQPYQATELKTRQGDSSNTTLPTGATLDPCYLNIHCLPQRYCIDLDSIPAPILCPSANSTCVCLPAISRSCTSDSQCPSNEVCAFHASAPPTICISRFVFETNSAFLPAPNDTQTAISSGTPPPVDGLTYDFCQFPEQCTGGRECRHFPQFAGFNGGSVSPFDFRLELCDSRDPCICVPPVPSPCFDSSNCPTGETCVVLLSSSGFKPICISQSTQVFLDIGSEQRPFPSPLPLNESLGLTLSSCVGSLTFCSGSRSCLRYPPSDGEFCNFGLGGELFEDCRCYPFSGPRRCNDDFSCLPPEVCALERSTGNRICMDPNAVNRQPPLNVTDTLGPRIPPSPEAQLEEEEEGAAPPPDAGVSSQDDGNLIVTVETSPPAEETVEPQEDQEASTVVCIAVDALQHLHRDDLIYAQDALAWVLCDSNGSCATAGHMVVYEGRALRMGRYCGMVGCERRMARVNSPRRRAGLRIGSRSSGLEFTAFAARYETVVEEMVLAVAVRLGL